VVGYNNSSGTITNCYYDKTISMVTKAVGNADDQTPSRALPHPR